MVGTAAGVVAGVTAAIALDYATNRLIAWANRDAFEADVSRSVATTFDELETLMAERLRSDFAGAIRGHDPAAGLISQLTPN